MSQRMVDTIAEDLLAAATRTAPRPAGNDDRHAGCGIAAGTVVLTLDGALPVEHLTEGDRVITRSGMQVLRGISSAVSRGGYTIRPHTLGHARPEDQITIGHNQQLLVRDWRAMALTGSAEALMPAARLADGEYIAASAEPVRMFRLCFDRDEVIYAGGLEALAPVC